MLQSLKDLEHYKVKATDGDIGKVVNFLLDDERWIVRYLIVQSGGPLFLDGRQVLVSPISFRQIDESTKHFHLALTMDKIKNGPSIDLDKPVSRLQEQAFFHHYGYPYYWGYLGNWGMGAKPSNLASRMRYDTPAEGLAQTSGDIHLRSAEEVLGYHIQGSDEAIGHVEEFIVDNETWEVRYLVVDTSNWWFGKKVLIAPQWVNRINWAEGNVYVDMSRQAIENGPQWNDIAAVDREFEVRLYDYYGRPVYWKHGDRPVIVAPISQR